MVNYLTHLGIFVSILWGWICRLLGRLESFVVFLELKWLSFLAQAPFATDVVAVLEHTLIRNEDANDSK